MALPSGTAAVCDRGIGPRALALSAERLSEVAAMLYGDPRYATRNHPPDWALLDPNVQLLSALSHVQAYRPWRGQRQRPYLDDVQVLRHAIEAAAPEWIAAAVAAQAVQLEAVRHRLWAELDVLHANARVYWSAVTLPAGQVMALDDPSRRDPQSGDTESLASLEARARLVLVAEASPALQLILADPRRAELIEALAQSRERGAAALERAFIETHEALQGFTRELRTDPTHIWFYAPIVVGTLQSTGALSSGRDQLAQFAVALARAVSASPYEPLWNAAALSLAALSLFTGPGAGIVLGLVDVLLTARSATARYQAEKERELAGAAQAFSGAQPFTDRAASFGPVALEAAAALLGAWQVGRLVRDARIAPPAAVSAERATAGRARAAVLDTASNERAVRDAAIDARATARETTGETADLATRGTQRDATRTELPTGAATHDADVLDVFRARGVTLAAAEEVASGIALGRVRLRADDRWFDGMLYWVRDAYYFVADAAHAWAVRIGHSLDEWAFDGERGISFSALGAAALDDAARAVYRLLRRRLTRAATDEEVRVVAAIEVGGWERVVSYVRGRVRASAVKGKIAEEVIRLTPEYVQALALARTRAVAEGFPEGAVVFLRDTRGTTVSAAAESGPGELGDGLLVAFTYAEGRPVAVRIFAVFESKSVGNARGLVTRKGEAIGQVGWDFERLRQVPFIIGEHTFAPAQVHVSRVDTDWYAMVPPEVPLTPLREAFEHSGWPQVTVFASPVRDKVLQDLAERVVQVVRTTP